MKATAAVIAAVFFLVALLFVVTADMAPSGVTVEEKAQIAAEVDSLTAEWWEAWSSFDWDRAFSFILDSSETTWTGAGPTLYSVAEMRESWIPDMAGFARQEMEFSNARTVVLGPDIVWTLREGDYSLVDTAGAVIAEGQFNETAVWVKRGGEWKVMLGHDDDTTPPAEVSQEG